MYRAIFGILIYCVCLPTFAERSNIGIVMTYYAFDEIREYCKWKHHGSYTIVDNQFQEWMKKYDSEIKAAYKGLEDEAKNNESKAKKLKILDSTLRTMWGERFVQMTDEES